MDKRKLANQQVKDKLLYALITLLKQYQWSKITITQLVKLSGVARVSYYRNFSSVEDVLEYGLIKMAHDYEQNSPLPIDDFNNIQVMEYKFKFYKNNMETILAFHRANTPTTLLSVITDCTINSIGDMPVSDISKYQLYFYSGAFYNMVITWLESGAVESPEEMAREFLRLVNNC